MKFLALETLVVCINVCAKAIPLGQHSVVQELLGNFNYQKRNFIMKNQMLVQDRTDLRAIEGQGEVIIPSAIAGGINYFCDPFFHRSKKTTDQNDGRLRGIR
jgi:hypothetical protein